MNLGASSLWIDHKYVGLLSSRLQQFKRAGSNTYKFRCPFCNDSQKSKLKTRGYVFENEQRLVFKCHNCGVATSAGKLIEHVDHMLYQEYRLECLKELGQQEKLPYKPDIGKFTKPRFACCDHLKTLKKISQLPLTHGARVYVEKRLIPTRFHHKLYYCGKFAHWVNSIVPDKFDADALARDEPRLIIPFIDKEGYLFGFQGRSFRPKTNLRYITIMLEESKPKIFGLDGVDFSQDVYILEGPLDSMFLPNALAMAGSDATISNYVSKDKAVVIYDNEPRSPIICKKIKTSIDAGYRVMIWPDQLDTKDINDLALYGWSEPEILEMVNTHTYRGLMAMTRLNTWKKCSI